MANEYLLNVKENVVRAAFGINGQCYLLVDASLKQYQSDISLYNALKNYKCFPIHFHHRDLEDALPLSLYMVSEKDIGIINDSIAHSLNEIKSDRLDSGEGRSVCAWISTKLTGEQLSEQIAQFSIQSTQSEGCILLRYFDPSVLGILMSVLDDWQKQQLLSNVNTWTFIDGDGIVQTMNGDGECRKKLSYSLGLSESVLLNIKNISIINSVLRVYRKINAPGEIRELEAAALLFPALSFFNIHFAPSVNDVTEFGLDILFARRAFYKEEMFDKYISTNQDQILPSYTDIKSRIKIHPF